jgi:MFS family permease
MAPSNRWLQPLCLASVLWAFSFGTNSSLASFWMEAANCDDTLIGLNTSAYYLSIALAACAVPWLMKRWSYRCLLVGMAASGVTAAAFPWGHGLVGWFLLRGLNGVAAALSLIPLEIYVNRRSPEGRRAQNFGYYAFSIALGLALGMLIGIKLSHSWPVSAFLLGGVAALLAALVVVVWKPSFPTIEESSAKPPALELTANFLSYGSAWSQGFLEGGMVALLPIYLLSTGLSTDDVSYLVAGLTIGIILAQVPVSWVSERLGRSAVLVACNVVTLLGIGAVLLPVGYTWLAVWLFFIGGCSGAFYPLGLALLGERTRPSGLPRASAYFLAINSVGSVVGPTVAGRVSDMFGRSAMFLAAGGAVALVLLVWLVLALTGRTAVAVEEAPPQTARAA